METICIPSHCTNLETRRDGVDELGYERTICYCKKLKRVIKSNECIKFPKDCPNGE